MTPMRPDSHCEGLGELSLESFAAPTRSRRKSQKVMPVARGAGLPVARSHRLPAVAIAIARAWLAAEREAGMVAIRLLAARVGRAVLFVAFTSPRSAHARENKFAARWGRTRDTVEA